MQALRAARVAAQEQAADLPLVRTRDEIAHLYERGRTAMAMNTLEGALRIMRTVTSLAPDHRGAWLDLAALLRHAGRDAEAREADAHAAAAPADAWPPAKGEQDQEALSRLDDAMEAQVSAVAEDQRIAFLCERISKDPLDVVALTYLADTVLAAGDEITAATLFQRALELSPLYIGARAGYADLLVQRMDYLSAYREAELLLAVAPDDFDYRLLRADAAAHTERFDEAERIYRQLLQEKPRNHGALRSYAALLKTLGRREEAEKTYRTMLEYYPNSGAAYQGLSELRANLLTVEDVGKIMERLAAGVRSSNSRRRMAYALAQTLEQLGEYEASFDTYSFAAKESREELAGTPRAHDPQEFALRLDRMRGTFSASAIAARRVAPPENPATTPIFIVGMPRAGSTLVEQILASHSQVEATRELPVVSDVVRRIALSRRLVEPEVYPERVLDYSREELDELGEEVLGGIAEYRRTALPFVIDKRPWNWVDAPFLHLVLPQAKFIDIRRAPMAACFAMFRQMLPPDAAFSYDLTHLGQYYRRYVEYMAYLDTVMPGVVLRVSYESLVDDTEAEIRRMLAYCGLPFEERCLRFWQTERAVLTPSAEQVRKPIYRGAKEAWKNFEPWLGELKESLGDLANT
jgi:tetratricopeptide (TPR) repeat protein